jgi:hypothetical protein
MNQGVSFLPEDLARTGTDKQLELAFVDRGTAESAT